MTDIEAKILGKKQYAAHKLAEELLWDDDKVDEWREANTLATELEHELESAGYHLLGGGRVAKELK